MSKASIPTYLEIIDSFILGNHRFHRQRHHTLSRITVRRPEAQQRIAELITREKEGGLSAEEKSELESLHGFGAHPAGSQGARPADPQQWLVI